VLKVAEPGLTDKLKFPDTAATFKVTVAVCDVLPAVPVMVSV
jgi:hypothetical protein